MIVFIVVYRYGDLECEIHDVFSNKIAANHYIHNQKGSVGHYSIIEKEILE